MSKFTKERPEKAEIWPPEASHAALIPPTTAHGNEFDRGRPRTNAKSGTFVVDNDNTINYPLNHGEATGVAKSPHETRRADLCPLTNYPWLFTLARDLTRLTASTAP